MNIKPKKMHAEYFKDYLNLLYTAPERVCPKCIYICLSFLEDNNIQTSPFEGAFLSEIEVALSGYPEQEKMLFLLDIGGAIEITNLQAEKSVLLNDTIMGTLVDDEEVY